MRRGPGIQGIQRNALAKGSYRQAGTKIQASDLDTVKQQMAVFHEALEDFAKKHRKDINRNPEFRKHFQDMCVRIGVDPLASNKGFWSNLLGVGDFYYELGVQIVEVCYNTRSRNGGLIEVGELRTHLEKMRGKNSQAISEDDVERAVKTLKTLEGGFAVVTIGRQKMVQSVPTELSQDHTSILELAQAQAKKDGSAFVTRGGVCTALKWTPDRAGKAIALLVREGMAWCDDQHESKERAFWFPSLMGAQFALEDD